MTGLFARTRRGEAGPGQERPGSHRRGLPIAIAGLGKRLGAQEVLRAVSLEVRAGEFLTLLGPSGSGKTTLLMAIAGFVIPDSGSIALGAVDVTVLPPHRRDIGIVFQSYALFPHLTVAQNLAYPLKLRRLGRAEIEARVRQALDLVRLPGLGDRSVDNLSGGQRQRVALARAIIFRPRILLMDEPLSALDKPLREAMQIELRRLHGELGVTTVYVTHDQREALTLSDRIAVMSHGEIVQVGAPREIYDRPRSDFVARFLGESTILEVEAGPGGATHAGRPLAVARLPAAAGRYGLLLRPERLLLLAPGAAPDAAVNRFPGRVVEVIFQGDSSLVTVTLADGTPALLRGPGQALVPGQAIELGLRAEDAVLVEQAAA